MSVTIKLNRTSLPIKVGTAPPTTAGVDAAGAVMETDFDAQTVLAATSDNTPAALTVAEQTLVGRITSGNVAALTATQVRTLLNVADGAEVNPDVVPKAEAEAGTATTERIWTAKRVAEAIAALGGGGSAITIDVRKGSAGTITKGTPVVIDGYNASGFFEVEAADADDATLMPAAGIAPSAVTNAATVALTIMGELDNMDTSAWAVGDGLWVSDSGTLTNARPTGLTAAVQRVGTVGRSHASLGTIFVAGAFRSNDIPNTTVYRSVSFANNPTNTVERVVRIPPGHRLVGLELYHRDPGGTPVVPTGGTMALANGATNQLDAASIALSSLTNPNVVLTVSETVDAGDATNLHATDANRDFDQGERLTVTVVNLACSTAAELYLDIILEPTP